MDDDNKLEGEELVSRAPTQEDFVKLCARLNELRARYIGVGGFAIITAGYPRSTMDIDYDFTLSHAPAARLRHQHSS